MIKRMSTDISYPGPDHHIRQAFATAERPMPNAHDGIRNPNIRQAFAQTERISSNAGEPVGHPYTRQAYATQECIIPNADDIVGDHIRTRLTGGKRFEDGL
jgi:hypothetical protein